MTWIRRRKNIEISTAHGTPPWYILNREEALQKIGAVGRVDYLKSFNQWIKLRNPLDLLVYSDGSRDEAGNVGAGYCIYRDSQKIISQKIILGPTVEVFDAEVIRALEGLRAVYFQMMSRYITNVAVCLDNQEVAIRLHSGLYKLLSRNQNQ